MSSPIDLTKSDEEIPSSQPRLGGKRHAHDNLYGGDETPTKRTHLKAGGSSRPSSFNSRENILPDIRPNQHTPTKSAKHAYSPRGSYLFPENTPLDDDRAHRPSKPKSENPALQPSFTTSSTSDNSDDETDAAFEFEETTRLEFERAAHHRIAKQAPDGHRLVDSACVNGCLLNPSTDIELLDGDFLRVCYIFWNAKKSHNDSSAYRLRGILLRRAKSMDNKFPKKLNELVAMISIPMDDYRSHFVAGLQDRSLAEFACTREIRFSNAQYPEFSFRSAGLNFDHGAASEESLLVCRFKMVERWHTNLKPYSEACLRLQPDEADHRYRKSNTQLIRQWFLDTRGRPDGRPSPNTAIQGDMADLYCGSGGASEAARLAGIRVAVAVDNKECAARSHQHNRPECVTLFSDVFDFITSRTGVGHTMCDLCHSSCPSRYWSPLHTVAGQNDDDNEAAAFMVQPAARKLGARIMSFEQTPGFARLKKHRPQWNAFIHQFTGMGFSVEWKLISFADTGCPNKRSRLWIFATCPGQQMPGNVQPTHGPPGSGLHSYVTVRDAIKDIPANATMHDPDVQADRFRAAGRSALQAAEWDKPLQHLIATAGPKALHPSGTRPFTVRETLCLQGFDTDYHFIGGEDGQPPSRTKAMEMAGDAVPPKPAAPFFKSAKEALHITDEEIAAYRDEVIILDD